MKRFKYYLLTILLCVSCVEEFNELPGDAGDPMLVVEGEIISGQTCTITLRRSSTLNDLSNYHFYSSLMSVHGSILLQCSDGSSYTNRDYSNGVCTIDVPVLDPNKSYTLHIFTEEMGDFHTDPMNPLYAPDIADFSFDMPNDDGQVHFNISTSDPNGPSYFMWRYDEYYEVRTPVVSDWDYDVDRGFFVRDFPVNLGWISITSNPIVTSSNEDYGNHAITEYTLFEKNNQELRFRTKYMAIIKQVAISVDEYEYHRLLRIQSTNSGGLFGTMPSELPSNLKRDDGKKAIGYVGIRGSVAEKYLIIGPKDVGYVNKISSVSPKKDDIDEDPAIMIEEGWAISSYGPQGLEWTKDWCVDCRTGFWDGGASLSKPDVWPY